MTRRCGHEGCVVSAPYQLLPPLTDGEYAELRDSIRDHGMHVAVLVDEAGHIIDGHHRAQIADELGIDYEVETVAGLEDDEKRAMALRLNLHRRSLSQAQKRELLASLLRAAPEKSDRQHAGDIGVSPSTVGSIRAELEESGQLSKLDSREGADGKVRPAKVTNTTRTTEATKVERDIDLDTGEIVDTSVGAPTVPEVTDNPIAAAKAEAAADPVQLAHKAVDRYRVANMTIDVIDGGLDAVMRELEAEPQLTTPELWLKDLDKAAEFAADLASRIRRRHVRSVK